MVVGVMSSMGDKLDWWRELLSQNKMIVALQLKRIFIWCKSTRKQRSVGLSSEGSAAKVVHVSASVILKIDWPHTSCHM